VSIVLKRVVIDTPDGHARAIAKAVTWRAIGTLDTFLWGWLITGHAGSAGTIASLEVLTKIILFYVHERIWRVLPMAPDSRARALIKAFSWRFFGSLDTFTLGFFVTGNFRHAATIASAEAISKIVLYYFHERIWRTVKWGRLEAKPTPAPQPAN
jgi:uncharacterized membrane protein